MKNLKITLLGIMIPLVLGFSQIENKKSVVNRDFACILDSP